MRNDTTILLSGYYQCLNGNITGVEVYQLSVDKEERGNHIIIRAESDSEVSNRTRFVFNPYVILEIVTLHEKSIDASVVEDIDNQVRTAIFPTRRTIGVVMSDPLVQVLNIRIESVTYLDEFDGTRYRHRKILRLFNRLTQLTN